MSHLPLDPLEFRRRSKPQFVNLRPTLLQSLTPLLAAVLAALVAIGAIAVGDGKDGFWARWPFLSGIFSGLLTLALTVVFVDALVRRRDRRTWANVASVGYRALARSSRSLVGGLADMYSDPERKSTLPWHAIHAGTANKHPLDQTRHALTGPSKSGLKIFNSKALNSDYASDGWIPLDRLRALLDDIEWIDFASARLDQDLDVNRTTVGDWASVMLGADEPRGFLDSFASLNDDIFALQQLLRLMAWENRRYNRPGVRDVLASAALRQWQVLDGKARILTNFLWAAAGEPEHSIAVPSWRIKKQRFIESFYDVDLEYPSDSRSTRCDLREWAVADLPEIIELIRPLATSAFLDAGASQVQIEDWIKSHLSIARLRGRMNEANVISLASRDKTSGQLLGVGMLSNIGPSAEISHVYVRNSNQGLGGQILSSLLLMGAYNGAESFYLVTTANNRAMLSLSRKYGFDAPVEYSDAASFPGIKLKKLGIGLSDVLPYPAVASFLRVVLPKV